MTRSVVFVEVAVGLVLGNLSWSQPVTGLKSQTFWWW
jgi:hypothetical protein